MKIGLEDWFQVENIKGGIAYNQWDSYKIRVVDNLDFCTLQSSFCNCRKAILRFGKSPSATS